ncbi:hypothetical protein [Halegenticoccus tardaugens]|uniref:hypothetical protein n=1 Tax=Halegenticoccus tardaugens TaxID=2071624 RepID=UPI00100B87C3|nr:hypothetical protein [Halegenticoccus tardaugens]
MSGRDATARDLLVGRAVLVVYALLVIPLLVGRLDARLMTPLAYPGYLLMTVGSSIGSALFPNYALWVYWAPFLAGSYALSVAVGGAYALLRGR